MKSMQAGRKRGGKRFLRTAAGAVLILLLGAAFGGGISREVTLEFGMFTGSNWGVENADAFLIIDRAIERFQEKHPHVRIRYTPGIDREDYAEWCAAGLMKGRLPDVFMVLDTDFSQYCSLGALQELDNFMEEDAEFSREEIFSKALDMGRGIDGAQYALPYEVVPTLLFVNKTLLKQEGIEIPDRDWTWEDFYEICRKVTRDTDGDGRINQFGTFNYTWLDAMYASGGTAFDDSGQRVDFTDEHVTESLKFMRRLDQINEGEHVTQEDFDAGNVAFMPLTFAEYRTYKTYLYKIKKYMNFQWDCTTIPARVRGENQSKTDALFIGIGKSSGKKEMAWEFLKELTCSEEGQMDVFRYSQGVPALKRVAGSEEASRIIQGEMGKGEQVISGSFLCDVIENGVTAPKFLPNEQYEQVIGLANTEISEIFEQNKNIESSVKIFQRKVNRYLSK